MVHIEVEVEAVLTCPSSWSYLDEPLHRKPLKQRLAGRGADEVQQVGWRKTLCIHRTMDRTASAVVFVDDLVEFELLYPNVDPCCNWDSYETLPH